MFRVEPVYISDEPNDGDLFTITASRKDLKILYDFLRSDDVFISTDRSSVDFIVNGLSKEIGND